MKEQRISVPTPNGSSAGAKLPKASIDLRRGGVGSPPVPNTVLGDSNHRRALTLHTTHLKTANFLDADMPMQSAH